MPHHSEQSLAFDPQTVANRTLGIGPQGIDRRTCQRTVPMRVLCLGPSRTGTTSLRQALMILGYQDCYHYASLMLDNPRDAEMWHEAWGACFENKSSFTRADWDQLLGHCQAVTDVPSCIFYRQLIEAYPEAKVILTVRDSPEQWHRSMLKTVMPLYQTYYLPAKTWSNWFYRFFMPPWTPRRSFDNRMCAGYRMYTDLDKDSVYGTRRAIAWLEGYHADIRSLVPSDRLLIWNVKEGWTPLCEFLGEDVPDIDFPKMNSTADWEVITTPGYALMDDYVRKRMLQVLGMVILAGVVAGTSAFLRF